MKFKGQKIEGRPVEYVPIIRPGGNIIFVVKGIQDLTEFNLICPPPKPPKVKLPGGKTGEDVNDKAYKNSFNRWYQLRGAWIFIKSLEDTEGFEWETVDPKNPETYLNWVTEMASGFIGEEIARIVDAVSSANSLNQTALDAARETFLQGEVVQNVPLSSPQAEVQNTSSGEPVLQSA